MRFSLPSHVTKKEKGILKVKIIVLSGLFETLVQNDIHIMHESFTDSRFSILFFQLWWSRVGFSQLMELSDKRF